MRFISVLILFTFIFTLGIGVPDALLYGDDNDNALTDALMGGLMGAGVGAAVGSASGDAGKGAGIGAGIGALGALLLGEMRRSAARRRQATQQAPYYAKPQSYPQPQSIPKPTPSSSYDKPSPAGGSITTGSDAYEAGRKKKIIREYDEYGDLVAEREVYEDEEE